MHRPNLIIFASLASLIASPILRSQEGALAVKIQTPPGQMKYDVTDVDAKPGQKVRLTLVNNDEMPHNLVIIKPTNDKGLALAMKAWEMGEKGLENGYIPADDRILAHTNMVGPHETQVVEFTAPKDPGEYPFVCTFPGHAMSMNGVLRVAGKGEGIKDLSYELYLGDWQQLPDFTKEKVFREGKLPDGLVGWNFDDYKNQFGMVYRGKLNVKTEGNHRFYLASDDGSELLIDGRSVLKNDGIHAASEVRRADAKLSVGDHEVELHYFEQAGEEQLYLAWQGPGFGETALSTWVPDNRAKGKRDKKAQRPGIELAPKDGRAVIYRNFIEGSSPRGIAVGYPGGTNLCFDADQMNLAFFWRGAFIDASRHWSDRGGGNVGPLGYAVVRPGGESRRAMAALADSSAPWPAREKRVEDVAFRGYTLDSKGFPTFSYQMGGLVVADVFNPPPQGTAVGAKFTRILTFKGAAEPNLYLRIANGQIKGETGSLEIDNTWTLVVEGATPVIRNKNEVIVPVTAGQQLKLIYGWLN